MIRARFNAFRAFSSATMPPTDATQAGEFDLGGES